MSDAEPVVKPCKDWSHFIEEVHGHDVGLHGTKMLYRGHASADWKVSSVLERQIDVARQSHPDVDIRDSQVEIEYLDAFKGHAVGIPGLDTADFDTNDWWMLGRHHGLSTRLLDWTYSPYVAAFFAFAELLEPLKTLPERAGAGNVAIWSLIAKEDLFKTDAFELIDSRKDAFYRQRAQRGVFTRLRHNLHVDLVSYLRERGELGCLQKIEVPASQIIRALSDLRKMNISYASVYPDLDGAAREANAHPQVASLAAVLRVAAELSGKQLKDLIVE